MRLLIIFAMSILCSLQCIAQGERNNWYFGDSVGVNFNNSSLGILNNGTTRALDACTSISDKNGNLLFYASGLGTSTFPNNQYAEIWNINNQAMQNSIGVFCYYSGAQGLITIPNSNNASSYYLFSLAGKQGVGIVAYYSTIDLTLDSGRGAVVQKNVLLCDSNVLEKMIAVKHANGRDWWLLIHEFNSNNFFEYLITPNGISGPFVISTGSCIGCSNTYDQGQMVFSMDGSKLCVASTYGVLDLYDFDRCSGILTLNQNLGVPYSSLFGWTTFYGCSFSENGQVLYVSRFDTLWQYDLNASNIKASRLYLMSVDNAEYYIGLHLIGPDNKIYLSTGRNNGSSDSLDYKLSVINYPDSVGLACDIRPHSIWLGGHRARGGLPNLPHYELGPLVGSACDTLTGIAPSPHEDSFSLKVYPNPASNQLTISSGQLANGKVVTVTVYDVLGKTQLQEKTTATTFDISALAAGIYMLQVQQGDKAFYGKFVKE